MNSKAQKPYLGNDIIDLRFLGKRTKELDKRYLQKVCTPLERACIYEAQDPLTCLVSHWAIKEAAYKVYVKDQRQRYFAPHHFEVLSLAERKVKVPNHIYSFTLATGPHWVHALCGSHIDPTQVCFHIAKLGGDKAEKSQALKTVALQYLSSHFSLPLDSLQFSSCSLNIPQIHSKIKGTYFDLSLSHDGDFGAFAVVKT